MKIKLLIFLFLILSTSTASAQNFWEVVPTPDSANLVSIAIHNNGDIFLGSNGVYMSQDNGETWEFKGLFGKTILAIAVDSVGNVFTGSTAKIHKSSDYGITWNVVHECLTNFVSFCPAVSGIIYAGCEIGPIGVIRSTDYGENWDTVLTLSDYEIASDFELASDGTIYLGTRDYMNIGGGVYQTSDNGISWEFIGLYNHYITSVAINSTDKLYAGSTGFNLGVFEKSKIGQSWTQLLDNVTVAAIIISSNDEIYVGCHYDGGFPGGCMFSSDYGESWDVLNSGLLSNDIDNLCLSPTQFLYAIASNTLYKSIQPIVSINTIDNNTNISLLPNPFTDNITIQMKSSFKNITPVTLIIYSIDGKSYYHRDLSASDNEYSMNIETLLWPSGLFYYIINYGNRSYSGKIIKIK